MNLTPNISTNTTQEENSENEIKKHSISSDKKKKKPFVERVGDWVCIKCKNLNFSFRLTCNRCQLSKEDSEKLFEQYMNNLMKYAKINEMLQNQVISNNHLYNSSLRNNIRHSRNKNHSHENISNSCYLKDESYNNTEYGNPK